MTFSLWQKHAIDRMQSAGMEPREANVSTRFLLDFHARQKNAALLFPDQLIENAAELEAHLKRLENREPLPYILGSAPFFGLEFEVSRAVLIPRPETETLVQAVLDRLKTVPLPRICDLGTGSGAISVSLAKSRADAEVWALEISSDAREIATRNAAKNGVSISLLEGASDWVSPLQNLGKFDALVSNPPYIAAHEIEALQPEVRDFEPRLALDGGIDGLAPYRIFARRGRDFLKNRGFFAVELGVGQFETVRTDFQECGWEVEPPILDFAGIARVLVAHAP